jgi:hypothetical protein
VSALRSIGWGYVNSSHWNITGQIHAPNVVQFEHLLLTRSWVVKNVDLDVTMGNGGHG